MALLEARERHEDLLEELIAEVASYNPDADRELIAHAFEFATRAHDGQERRSGEAFIHHPFGAAKICAELRLDDETIAAALLHDVVEDTDVGIDEVRVEFGDEIANLVEGVTKLTRIQFQSREHAEAENYRKMIVAMAHDVRVILIKLADRLHNMRTLEYLGRQKQVQKARETLEVYAPLAHRLGIHKLKWELEDLAFQTLHPRKYAEIEAMVAERRADREEHVREAAIVLTKELDKVGIPAEISGRAKHFYSIYDKMAKKGREFNEIYDLTAMRVIVDRAGDEGTRDCYGALGLIHSLWKPMPGRFKDYIAMPKFNGYRALHTTVIGPAGSPLEIQIRTREMHDGAEFGIAAHWYSYKPGGKKKLDEDWLEWVKQLMEWGDEEADPREFIKGFRTDLFDDEVYVFTPKGEVKTLPAGSTPIDFAYSVHTDVGPPHRRREGQRADRSAPLHAAQRRLRRDPDVEGRPRPVARLDGARPLDARAEQDPPVVLARDARGHRAQGARGARAGAEGAEAAVPQARGLGGARAGDPRDRLQEGRGLLHRARLGQAPGQPDRQEGARSAEDRRGGRGRDRPAQAEAADDREHRPRDHRPGRGGRPRPAGEVLHAGAERRDRRLHLARQGGHDPPQGLSEREGADAESRAVHRRRLGRRDYEELLRADRRRRVGPARACSRTSPGRSRSTARTSSRTAGRSRISSRRTGTRPSSAT